MEIKNIKRKVSFLESAKNQNKLKFTVSADLTNLTKDPKWNLWAQLRYTFSFTCKQKGEEEVFNIKNVNIIDFMVMDVFDTHILHLTGEEYKKSNVQFFLDAMNLTLLEFLVLKQQFEADSDDFLIQFLTAMKHKMIAIPEPEPTFEAHLTVYPKCEKA